MAAATATASARPSNPLPKQLLAGALFAGSTIAAAGIGSIATSRTTDSAWFRALDKPPWYPPSWTFGAVWTVLYILIALGGWLAWRAGAPPRAMAAWAVQIVLNLGWTLVFFGLHRPGWALAEIAALLVAAAWSAWELGRVNRTAGRLMVPYVAWVAFASTLNAGIAYLNA